MLAVRRAVPALFILIALQAAAAAGFLALDPHFGGLSSLPAHTARLAGLLALLALVAAAALLAAARPALLESTAFWRIGLIGGLVLAIGTPLLLAALEAVTQSGPLIAYANYPAALTLPALVFTLSGVEFLILAAFRFRSVLAPVLARHRALALILSVLALVFAAVLVTRIGVRDLDNLFYGHPGIPLLEWQILLAACAGLGLAALSAKVRVPLGRRADAGLFLAVWLGTAVLWQTQALVPGGYALAPAAPNFEIYPFSDAMQYAVYAQSLLAGAGFNGLVPPRPLYITLLAGMHALAGPDYSGVIALQSAVLALFPALLYLLASRLAGRPAGLMLALLAALRDLNTNLAAPFATNISYSKLYLSELPTALLLVLTALLLVRWSRRGLNGWWEPLLAGGLTGMAVLVRTQSLIVLPAAFALLFLGRARGVRLWLRGLALATLAAGLVILPWLWRNLQVTGGLVFDDPVTQTMVLAQRYGSVYFSEPIPQEPGETTATYTSRLMTFALDNLRRDPGRILSAAASHYVNNLAGSLRVLPLRAAIRGPGDFWFPNWPFWETRLESFGPGLTLLLGFALLVFGIGLSAAFARLGWAGLLPLAINLAYNLWSALFLTSGERFLLPVDWAFLLYLCAGLFALLAALYPRLLPEAHEVPPLSPRPRARPLAVAALLAVCLLVGAGIPLAERLIPPRYPETSQSDLLARLAASGLDPALVESLSATPAFAGRCGARPEGRCPDLAPSTGDTAAPLPENLPSLVGDEKAELTILQGRAIYPLYFPPGGGIPGVEDLGYRSMPQSRLVFRIAGPRSVLAVLPLDAPPDFFPNGADVLALGREENGVFLVAAAWVHESGEGRLWTASP